jgi:regulator of sigma E protease
MLLLAFNWTEFGVKAGQFVLSFSIIVVLHELGHFRPPNGSNAGRKFYLFFNPWFSLPKRESVKRNTGSAGFLSEDM